MLTSSAPGTCANCAATLGGRFCAACGQRDVPPDPTLRELAGEAWDTFVSVDGKLVNTARLLVLRPGEITARYAAGHRVAFLPPLRLYLVSSAAFFLVEASLPAGSRAVRVSVSNTTDRKTPEQVSAEVARMNAPAWRKRLKLGAMRAAYTQQASFGDLVFAHAPQATFALVPLLAGLVALVYRRRGNYPSHLVFALHAQAGLFAILAIAGGLLVVVPHGARRFVGLAALCVMLAYLPRALRRVYGGSWPSVVGRSVFLFAGYAVGVVASLAVLAVGTMWALGAP